MGLDLTHVTAGSMLLGNGKVRSLQKCEAISLRGSWAVLFATEGRQNREGGQAMTSVVTDGEKKPGVLGFPSQEGTQPRSTYLWLTQPRSIQRRSTQPWSTNLWSTQPRSTRPMVKSTLVKSAHGQFDPWLTQLLSSRPMVNSTHGQLNSGELNPLSTRPMVNITHGQLNSDQLNPWST